MPIISPLSITWKTCTESSSCWGYCTTSTLSEDSWWTLPSWLGCRSLWYSKNISLYWCCCRWSWEIIISWRNIIFWKILLTLWKLCTGWTRALFTWRCYRLTTIYSIIKTTLTELPIIVKLSICWYRPSIQTIDSIK